MRSMWQAGTTLWWLFSSVLRHSHDIVLLMVKHADAGPPCHDGICSCFACLQVMGPSMHRHVYLDFNIVLYFAASDAAPHMCVGPYLVDRT